MPISTTRVPAFYRMDNEDPLEVPPLSTALQSDDHAMAIADWGTDDESGEDSDSSVAVPVQKTTTVTVPVQKITTVTVPVQKSPKILKPKGKGGQKRGYNLEKALAWGGDEFRDFETQLHELVELNLDPSRLWKAQKKAPRDQIRQIMTDRFPKLREYAASWPVDVAMQLRLKYTSEKVRRLSKEATAAAAEDALAAAKEMPYGGSSIATEDAVANVGRNGQSIAKANAERVPSVESQSLVAASRPSVRLRTKRY